MREKKKNSKKKIVKNMILAIVIFLIVAYISYIVINLIRKPTETFLIENGKISLEENITGYIIREEQVIEGVETKDGIKAIKSEGEKVSKNEVIYRYYSNSEDELNKKIAELDIQIGESLQNENTIFSSDIKALEGQIESELQIVHGLNNMSEIVKRKDSINSLINKKAKIAGELSPTGSYIKSLIQQRSGYENQLNSISTYVSTPISGIVSYKIDGLETVLTKDSFNTLSKEKLEGLNLKTGQVIASSTKNAKIINNFDNYIAAVMSSEQAKNAEVGSNVKLRFNDIGEIQAIIEYKAEDENGEVIIVFKTNTKVEQLTSYRKISLDVIWWSYKGLKVPNSAILQEGEKTSIIRVRSGYLDKILVNIKKQNSDYAIIVNYTLGELRELGYITDEVNSIKTVSLYDEITCNPRSDMIK